jgi:hypothetical protein
MSRWMNPLACASFRPRHPDRLPLADPPLRLDPVRQRLAVDVLHDEEPVTAPVALEVEHRDDVLVDELRLERRLALELLDELLVLRDVRRQELDRDQPVEVRLLGEPDHAHRARAELPDQLVAGRLRHRLGVRQRGGRHRGARGRRRRVLGHPSAQRLDLLGREHPAGHEHLDEAPRALLPRILLDHLECRQHLVARREAALDRGAADHRLHRVAGAAGHRGAKPRAVRVRRGGSRVVGLRRHRGRASAAERSDSRELYFRACRRGSARPSRCNRSRT